METTDIKVGDKFIAVAMDIEGAKPAKRWSHVPLSKAKLRGLMVTEMTVTEVYIARAKSTGIPILCKLQDSKGMAWQITQMNNSTADNNEVFGSKYVFEFIGISKLSTAEKAQYRQTNHIPSYASSLFDFSNNLNSLLRHANDAETKSNCEAINEALIKKTKRFALVA